MAESLANQHMIALGLLNDETLERAIEEIRVWYNHPGAFHFQPEVFAAGRVDEQETRTLIFLNQLLATDLQNW